MNGISAMDEPGPGLPTSIRKQRGLLNTVKESVTPSSLSFNEILTFPKSSGQAGIWSQSIFQLRQTLEDRS